MPLNPIFENPWVRAGAFLAALVVLLFLGIMLKSVLIPLFFAFMVAYIFDPVVDIFERRGLSRTRVVVLLVLGIILIALLLPVLILPGVISQAEDLIMAAGKASEGEDPWLDRTLRALPLDEWVVALGWAEADREDLNARAVTAEKLGEFIKNNALAFAEQHGRDMLAAGQTAGQSAAAFFTSIRDTLLGFIIFLGNFALFAIVSIYLLKDYDTIIAALDDLVPPHRRTRARHIAGKIDTQLKGFLRGQLTVCLFLGVVYTTGMLIAGTPFAVPLGILGGAASFIPYVGIAITILPAVGLTLLQYGLDWHLVAVIATFMLAQTLESYVITPKFVGEQVGLGPVWVILAVVVFSSTFGFVGLLLALPTAAVLKVFVEEALLWYRQSTYFVGDASEGSGAASSD